MTTKPTLWGRFVAAAKGEVSAQTLEAYRQAGAGVYALLDAAEALQHDAAIEHGHAWRLPAAGQAQLLFTWNAFVLQTLGDQFLDADYAHDPSTAGFVPAITAKQCQASYDKVARWLSLARRAEKDPNFVATMPLPAGLPPWYEADPCPYAHLMAMLAALRAIRLHADAALGTVLSRDVPAERAGALGRVKQLLAEAETKADYAENMLQPNVTAEIHERIEKEAQAAIALYYQAGQVMAMPSILERKAAPKAQKAKAGDGTDDALWVLTDPVAREALAGNDEVKQLLTTMWQEDPDPARTQALADELAALLAKGHIGHALLPCGTRMGHNVQPPWATIYVCHRPITLGEVKLPRGEEFTVEITAIEGTPFQRAIVQGPFGPQGARDWEDHGHDDEDEDDHHGR